MKTRKPIVVDLFAGCGGLSLGFIEAGYDVVGALENWKPAIDTYRANFAHPVIEFDLLDVEAAIAVIRERFRPEVVIGGPPCQDFSIANNKKTAKRANLTMSFARIAMGVGAKLIVMENVYNIERYPVLKRVLNLLREGGYGVSQTVIDASRVGVPQMRRRYFLVAVKGGKDDLVVADLENNLSEERTTVRDYFKDSLGTDYYYAHPRSYHRRAIFSVDEPAATIRRVNRPIPKNYKTHPADKCSPNEGVRPLTTSERARIQTFPTEFKFVGSTAQKEQLIGNAVPVLLARYVASAVKKHIR